MSQEGNPYIDTEASKTVLENWMDFWKRVLTNEDGTETDAQIAQAKQELDQVYKALRKFN